MTRRIVIGLSGEASDALRHAASAEHRSIQAQAAWMLETLLLRPVDPETMPRQGEASLSLAVARMTEAINSTTAGLEVTTERMSYLKVPRVWAKALRIRWGEMLEHLP